MLYTSTGEVIYFLRVQDVISGKNKWSVISTMTAKHTCIKALAIPMVSPYFTNIVMIEVIAAKEQPIMGKSSTG